MKPSLQVDLGGVVLRSPVVAAAGAFGTGRELAGLVDVRRLGGAVSRSVTLAPSKGSSGTRVAETPSGLLSSVGLQNPGIEAFLERDLPSMQRSAIPIFVSIGGASLEEYVRLTGLLQPASIAGIEVYLGGRDEGRGGLPFLSSKDHVAEVVGAVARLSRHPVFAKLPASVPELVETAHTCVRAGVHGLTVEAGVSGMAIDSRRLRPELGTVTGSLSGPAVKPVTVRAVFEVARAMPEVPLFGVGGVAGTDDAVELMLAGAWAVQVCTGMLVDPAAPVVIAEGILAYLESKGLADPADIRGRVRVPDPAVSDGRS